MKRRDERALALHRAGQADAERHLRGEFRNEALFFGLDHARSIVADWVADYNAARPHSALGYQTPAAYAAQFTRQRAIGSTKRKRSADRPLLPPRKRAIVTRRLWLQLDEGRGSRQ